MTLRVTYYSDYKLHKDRFMKVSHWYYEDGNLVIITSGNEITFSNVILLNCETWIDQ